MSKRLASWHSWFKNLVTLPYSVPSRHNASSSSRIFFVDSFASNIMLYVCRWCSRCSLLWLAIFLLDMSNKFREKRASFNILQSLYAPSFSLWNPKHLSKVHSLITIFICIPRYNFCNNLEIKNLILVGCNTKHVNYVRSIFAQPYLDNLWSIHNSKNIFL